jgi:tRNA1Val (adenine37-N6)-methyltransferase
MSDKPFRFKQFQILQDRCAQKVGTDGVLLGAWCSKDSRPQNILDIGTGSGVIALMLAQRFPEAYIDALEIDESAFTQANENFLLSHWNERLTAMNEDLLSYRSEKKYELIVSNPPFFQQTAATGNVPQNRQTARFDSALPLEDLISSSKTLLKPSGTLAIILPFVREQECMNLAIKYQFETKRICHVKGNRNVPTKRVMFEFRFRESETKMLSPQAEELVIEKSRHVYTTEYIELTKRFYLNMPDS